MHVHARRSAVQIMHGRLHVDLGSRVAESLSPNSMHVGCCLDQRPLAPFYINDTNITRRHVDRKWDRYVHNRPCTMLELAASTPRIALSTSLRDFRLGLDVSRLCACTPATYVPKAKVAS